ncbi:hypothetical protein E4U25_006515 [Claviceps purpurea]|nr:hypothetical protein E4U25_006515 [Claviceps purpurea]
MAIQNATIDRGSGYGPGLALAFPTSHGLLAAAETTSESESIDHEAKLVSTVWDETSSGIAIIDSASTVALQDSSGGLHKFIDSWVLFHLPSGHAHCSIPAIITRSAVIANGHRVTTTFKLSFQDMNNRMLEKLIHKFLKANRNP